MRAGSVRPSGNLHVQGSTSFILTHIHTHTHSNTNTYGPAEVILDRLAHYTSLASMAFSLAQHHTGTYVGETLDSSPGRQAGRQGIPEDREVRSIFFCCCCLGSFASQPAGQLAS